MWDTDAEFAHSIDVNDVYQNKIIKSFLVHSDLPQFLEEIYTYRYDNRPDNVQKLIEDILFWKNESKVKKRK